MNQNEYNDDKLNMFIDEQLDTDEMNGIREAILDDPELRERVCQLKAVRDLVGFAYQNAPRSRWDRRKRSPLQSNTWKSLAASILLGLGVLLGWQSSNYVNHPGNIVSAENAFTFFANQAVADSRQRKILLHLSTDDTDRVDSTMREVNTLLASYRNSGTPLKMEIVANKTGINLLRPEMSAYMEDIEKMVLENDVVVYACERAITKAEANEGHQVVLMPEAITNREARELIPERLEQGWVYIKV